jgi:hypothetical protein
MYRIDRRVWASVLFRTTTPDIIEGVIVKRSERLHWSRESAMEVLVTVNTPKSSLENSKKAQAQ